MQIRIGMTTQVERARQQWMGAVVAALALVTALAPRATAQIPAVDVWGQQSFSTMGPGAAPVQLNLPSGAVVDSSGNLYVADTGNNRVERYQPGEKKSTGGSG